MGPVTDTFTVQPGAGRPPKSTTVVQPIEPPPLVRVEVGGDPNVADVHLRTRLDPHRAVQAGHPPLILVLDVAVSAVADHDDRQLVRPRPDEIADVVLARQAAVGAVAGEHPVDVHGVNALGSGDVEHRAPAKPTRRDVERATVDTRRVAIGQSRGWPLERHLDVGVVRTVDEATEVLHRPVAGHLDVDGSATYGVDRCPPAPSRGSRTSRATTCRRASVRRSRGAERGSASGGSAAASDRPTDAEHRSPATRAAPHRRIATGGRCPPARSG